jgi:hypothetical protein
VPAPDALLELRRERVEAAGPDDQVGGAGGLVPPVAGVEDHLRGVQESEPRAKRLAGRHLAEPDDQVRGERQRRNVVAGNRRAGCRSCRPARDGVVGADDEVAVVRSEAKLRGRLGDDREPEQACECSDRLGVCAGGHPAGDDQPVRGVANQLGEAVELGRAGRTRSLRDLGQRPRAAAPQRQRRARGYVAPARLGPERVAPGAVEVHGAGPRVAGGGRVGAAGDRPVMEQPGVVGLLGSDLAKPPHRRAVELHLVDRLPGANPAQLRRPVGGEHDHRHGRLVRLADRRVEVGRGRPGRAQDHGRTPARLRRPEGEERRRSLVDDRRHPDPGLAKQR